MPWNLFSKQSKSMVGLDIGTSRIKLVELISKAGTVQLARAAVQLTPANAVKDGMITQPELVAEAIKAGLAAGRFKSEQVVAAIAGQGVIARHVKFPRMPAEEVREALKWEGQKYIPYPIEEAVVDFEIIDGMADPNAPDMEVMLVASQKRLVDSHVKAIELAGLSPIAIDVQPFTVLRALRWEPKGDSAKAGRAATAYIDIGAGTTDIVIAEGERLRFTRIVPTGGNSFTAAIAERLGVSFDEAEQIKIDEARLYEDESECPVTDDRGRAIVDAVFQVASSIAVDVRRSLDYHDLQLEARSQDAGVTGVVLTGGGSVLEGLDRYFAAELGLATWRGDALRNLAISPKLLSKGDLATLGPMLAVGIGLALREVADS
ncbi:MAG: type IV pilus assembly protein PilM [Clostridia bacterium]|nr:type IV pilus assembly protein PilM [Clostridia bacterium]